MRELSLSNLVHARNSRACVNALPVLGLAREISPLYASASCLSPSLFLPPFGRPFKVPAFYTRLRYAWPLWYNSRNVELGRRRCVVSHLATRGNSWFDIDAHIYICIYGTVCRSRPEFEFENGIRHRSAPVYTIARKSRRKLCRGVAAQSSEIMQSTAVGGLV